MRLLPDIIVNGTTISLQAPYTINGRLIKNVSQHNYEIHGTRNNFDMFLFNTIDDFTYVINKIKLLNKFQHVLDNYIFQHGCSYIDEYEQVNPIPFDTFEEYLDEIKKQISNFNRDKLILEERLRRQNRGPIDINIQSDIIESVSQASYNPFTFNSTSSQLYASSHSTPKKYIHPYNYKPNYIPHYVDGEDEETTLLLGAEIEVAGNTKEPDREKVVKKCIQIMNGSDSDEENLIYSTHDGTVQIELDTMPCSLEFHKNKMNYKKLFSYLDKIGYKGHDCDSAGLHIHACRSYLGKTPLVQQLTTSKILYILEKFNEQICVIARRDNFYSQFVGKGKDENSVIELYGNYKRYGKRVALNLEHENTIEFRMFKSTLKPKTLLLTFEFVKDIIDFAKLINIEEIECIQWEDLMKTFSNDLRTYYNSRLRKKSEKDIDKVVKQLKNKISSLKKQVNHCTNYMERKCLQLELNNTQKELAKLKKNIN